MSYGVISASEQKMSIQENFSIYNSLYGESLRNS